MSVLCQEEEEEGCPAPHRVSHPKAPSAAAVRQVPAGTGPAGAAGGNPNGGESNLQRQSLSTKAIRKFVWFLEGAIFLSVWCYTLEFLQHGKGRWNTIYLVSPF